jgi:putative membrane protein
MSDFESDSVSSLHKRWLFTNINPSSEKFSFLISILSLATNVALINFVITPHTVTDFLVSFPIIAAVFSITLVFDYLSLKGTPLNRFSKVLHVSAFANLLWTLTVIGGFISEFIINTNSPNINFVLQGMFMAIGLRIGIFVSVFGASLKRTIPISFIQPLIIFILISFFYFNHIFYTNITVYVFGSVILFIGVMWTIIVDRIGRPNFTSAFKILQAFLIAWTENKSDEMEKIAEAKASPKVVNTLIMKFRPKDERDISLVLPELHPGPFNPIGGSNLPFDIFKFYSNSAMVMHSISDHSLNIPSKKEVEKYLKSLNQINHLETGTKCTLPITITRNDCNCSGFALGKNVIILFSKSPSGMEDIPLEVKTDLEVYAQQIGFKQIMIIDAHNSMGAKLEENDVRTLINIGKETLLKLIESAQYDFKIGYANSFQINDQTVRELQKLPDLGQGQFGVLALSINNDVYLLCWIDSNNMKNGIREKIAISLASQGFKVIEICTSDTHATSGKRNTKGYYTLGDVTSEYKIINVFDTLATCARTNLKLSTFEIYKTESQVMVMGTDQFDHYSNALEKSFLVTKIFLAITFVVYVLMLLFT